jgi:hypothetical protein
LKQIPDSTVLAELVPHLKKTLGLVDVEVLSVEGARSRVGAEAGFTQSIIDGSEPGSPSFEYRNVAIDVAPYVMITAAADKAVSPEWKVL